MNLVYFDSLLKQLLQFHNHGQSQYEREQYLLRLFDINQANDLHLRQNLFLLNDLLNTKFRRSDVELENSNETNIDELILHILNKLIEIPDHVGQAYLPTTIATTTNPIRYE